MMGGGQVRKEGKHQSGTVKEGREERPRMPKPGGHGGGRLVKHHVQCTLGRENWNLVWLEGLGVTHG